MLYALTVVLILIIAFFVCLLILQKKMVFFPQAPSEIEDEICLQMKDGTKIKGWIVENKLGEEKTNILLYFGGNKEEVSTLLEGMKRLKGWVVVLLNYRGYGSSEGKPSEKKLYSDSLEIYDHFSKLSNNYNTSKIVVMGRSLGSGIATYVASQRNVSGVILVSPYDRISNAAKYKFPKLSIVINIIFKLRFSFDSLSRAHMITAPLLVLATPTDKSVPYPLSQNLLKNWNGPSKLIKIPDETHRSLSNTAVYWNGIAEFLDNLSNTM